MSAYSVTVRQLGHPPLKFYAIGAGSGDVGDFIALHFGACGISVKPL
ncbi:hypothetical protein ACEN9F_13505 [Duganella sp. CT11-25]